MTRRRRQEIAEDASREFPPVTIRCPECGAFLREVAHAAGDFTVVACGPCGETFRLSKNLDDWLPRRARLKTAVRDADALVDARPSKARIKHR
jgi:hypothetical protein